MAAEVKVVSKEDWPIIEKYLLADGSNGIVLVKAEVAKKYDIQDHYAYGYGFCGSPDVVIDIVKDSRHAFLDLDEEDE